MENPYRAAEPQWSIRRYKTWDQAEQRIAQENWPNRELQQAWRQAVGGRCSGGVRSEYAGTLGDVTRTKDWWDRNATKCRLEPLAPGCPRPLEKWEDPFATDKSVPTEEQLKELNGGLPTEETIYQWEKKDYEKYLEMNKKVHEYVTPVELDAYYDATGNLDIFRFDPQWMFLARRCMSFFGSQSLSAEELLTGNGTRTLGLGMLASPDATKMPLEFRFGKPYNNGWKERFELWKNPPPPPPPKPLPRVYNLEDVPRVFERACKELCAEGANCGSDVVWRKATIRVEAEMDRKIEKGVEQKLNQKNFDFAVETTKKNSKSASYCNDPPPCDCTPPASKAPPPAPDTWIKSGSATTVMIAGAVIGTVITLYKLYGGYAMLDAAKKKSSDFKRAGSEIKKSLSRQSERVRACLAAIAAAARKCFAMIQEWIAMLLLFCGKSEKRTLCMSSRVGEFSNELVRDCSLA